jgi:hypothetical protein
MLVVKLLLLQIYALLDPGEHHQRPFEGGLNRPSASEASPILHGVIREAAREAPNNLPRTRASRSRYPALEFARCLVLCGAQVLPTSMGDRSLTVLYVTLYAISIRAMGMSIPTSQERRFGTLGHTLSDVAPLSRHKLGPTPMASRGS